MNWYKQSQQKWQLTDLPNMIVKAFSVSPHNQYGTFSLYNLENQSDEDVSTSGMNNKIELKDSNNFFDVAVETSEFYNDDMGEDSEDSIVSSLIAIWVIVHLGEGHPSYPNRGKEEIGFSRLNGHVSDINSIPYNIVKECYDTLDTYIPDDSFNDSTLEQGYK